MTRRLQQWAVTERAFLQREIEEYRAGATLRSPSGEDVTATKLDELVIRLEHATIVVEDLENDGKPRVP